MIGLSGMARLDQRVSGRAGLEFRVYADFLPNAETLKTRLRQSRLRPSRLRQSRRKAELQTGGTALVNPPKIA